MTDVGSLPPISSTFGCTDFEFFLPGQHSLCDGGYINRCLLFRPSSQEHADQVVRRTITNWGSHIADDAAACCATGNQQRKIAPPSALL